MENILFDCNSDIVKPFEEITGIGFSKRFAGLKEIKDMVAFQKTMYITTTL